MVPPSPPGPTMLVPPSPASTLNVVGRTLGTGELMKFATDPPSPPVRPPPPVVRAPRARAAVAPPGRVALAIKPLPAPPAAVRRGPPWPLVRTAPESRAVVVGGKLTLAPLMLPPLPPVVNPLPPSPPVR